MDDYKSFPDWVISPPQQTVVKDIFHTTTMHAIFQNKINPIFIVIFFYSIFMSFDYLLLLFI